MANQETLINRQNGFEPRKDNFLNGLAKEFERLPSAVVLVPVWTESLESLSQKGSILRSIHIGNDYPSNEAFAALPNVRLIVYERTTLKDANYAPWKMRKNGDGRVIAQASDGQLSPFFAPNEGFYHVREEIDQDELNEAQTPAQLHFRALRLIHPTAQTWSEYILENRRVVEPIVEVLNSHVPNLIFNRQLTGDGRITSPDSTGGDNSVYDFFEGAQCLQEAVILGNNQARDGVLINTNQFNVYMSMVVESLKPENQRNVNGETWGYVFHGSGPDMIRYVEKYTNQVNVMHDVVTSQLPDLGLPKKIFFGVAPTAELKLALPAMYGEGLDSLGCAVDELVSAQRRIRDFQNTTEAQRRQARQDLPEFRRRLAREINSSSISDKLAEIELKKTFSTHASQYDVLEQGRISFPSQLMQYSFGEIAEINRLVESLRESENQNGKFEI